jgi:hypothetical protein
VRGVGIRSVAILMRVVMRCHRLDGSLRSLYQRELRNRQ